MPPQSKYIYGIIRDPEPKRFDFPGVGDGAVYTLTCHNLAAVVSDTELKEIDPTRKNVRTHALVQDGVLKDYTLIPASFGMVAGNGDEVLRLLEKNYDGLHRELTRLANKVEVELKVFWNEPAMIKELQSLNGELTKLKTRIKATSSPVEIRSLLVEAGRLVERTALDWKEGYAEQVYATLKELSADAKLNSLLGIKNILNASFLIERSKEKDFQKEVYKMDSHYQGNMNFRYVGPMAPYNFISLKLETI